MGKQLMHSHQWAAAPPAAPPRPRESLVSWRPRRSYSGTTAAVKRNVQVLHCNTARMTL
jgi:hypothetical protein